MAIISPQKPINGLPDTQFNSAVSHAASTTSSAFSPTSNQGEVDQNFSNEALEDHFNGDHKDKVKVFAANQERIEHEARRKYLAGLIEADGSVLVKTGDV